MKHSLKHSVFFLLSLAVSSTGIADAFENPYAQPVRSIVDTHRLAVEYHDWRGSGNTPKDLIDKIAAKKSPRAEMQSLCEAVKDLPLLDGTLFLSDFLELGSKMKNSCIDGFIEVNESYFETKMFIVQSKLDFGSPFAYSPNQLSPTKKKIIPVADGPRFVTADLPKKTIAFTFDDGPHKTLTQKLIRTLRHHKIEATFFVVGQNVKRFPGIVQELIVKGHTVGTHSWSHKQLPKVSYKKGVDEIDEGFISVIDVMGQVAPFFRFPYGARTSSLKKYLKQSDIADFFWTVDTLDWKIKDPEDLFEYSLKQIESAGRGIVLFHDVQPQTIAMMPTLLPVLNKRGYKTVLFVPDEYIEREE